MNGANQGNPGMMPYSQGQHPHPPPPPGMPYHHANGPQSMGYHSVPGQQPYMYGQYGHAASYQQYYPMNYPNYQHPHPYYQYPPPPVSQQQPQVPPGSGSIPPPPPPPPPGPTHQSTVVPQGPQPQPANYSAAPTVRPTLNPYSNAAGVPPPSAGSAYNNSGAQQQPAASAPTKQPVVIPITESSSAPSTDPRATVSTNNSTATTTTSEAAKSQSNTTVSTAPMPTPAAPASTFNFDLHRHKARLTAYNRKEGWQKYLNDEDRQAVENILKEAAEFDNQYANFEKEFTKMSTATSALGDNSLKVYNSMWSEWKGNLLARREQMTKLQDATLDRLYKKVCQNFPLFITKSQPPEKSSESTGAAAAVPMTTTTSTANAKAAQQSAAKPAQFSPQKGSLQDARYQPPPAKAALENQMDALLSSARHSGPQPSKTPPTSQPASKSQPPVKPVTSSSSTSRLTNIPGIPSSEMGNVATILQIDDAIESTISECLVDFEFQRAHNDFSFLRNQVKFVHDLLLAQKSRSKKAYNAGQQAGQQQKQQQSTGPSSSSQPPSNAQQAKTRQPLLGNTPGEYMERREREQHPQPPLKQEPLLPAPSNRPDACFNEVMRMLPRPAVVPTNSQPIPTIHQSYPSPKKPLLTLTPVPPGRQIQTIGIAASSKSKYQQSTQVPVGDGTTINVVPLPLPPQPAAPVVPSRPAITLKLPSAGANNVKSKAADIFEKSEKEDTEKGGGGGGKEKTKSGEENKNAKNSSDPKQIPTLTRSRKKVVRPETAATTAVVAEGGVDLEALDSPTTQQRQVIDITSVGKWKRRDYERDSRSESHHSERSYDRRDRDRDRDRRSHSRERDDHHRDRDRERDRHRRSRSRDRDRHRRSRSRSRDRSPSSPFAAASFIKSTYYESVQPALGLATATDTDTIDTFLERERATLQLKPADLKPSYMEPRFFTVPRKYTEEPLYIKDLLELPARIYRPPRICLILRGLPGSGKSYLAKLIKDREEQHDALAKTRLLSLDDYFVVEKTSGEELCLVYEYDPAKESDYKCNLFKAFRKTLLAGYHDFVLVDSINASITDVRHFYACAVEHNFIPYVIEMEAIVRRVLDDCILGEEIVAYCYKHNRHGRSLAEIRALYESWELLPAEYLRVDAYSMVADAGAGAQVQPPSADTSDTTNFLNSILEESSSSQQPTKLTVVSDYDTEDVPAGHGSYTSEQSEPQQRMYPPPAWSNVDSQQSNNNNHSPMINSHNDVYSAPPRPMPERYEEHYHHDNFDEQQAYKRSRFGDEVTRLDHPHPHQQQQHYPPPPYERPHPGYEQQPYPIMGQEPPPHQQYLPPPGQEFASAYYGEQGPGGYY